MVILIPAKSSSRRVPNKNIRMLGKHPLIEWVLHYTKWFPDARVVVATDSEPIFRYAQSVRNDVFHHPLTTDDVYGRREASDLIVEFAKTVSYRPLLVLSPAAPFVFRSELLSALRDDRAVIQSGRVVPHHTEATGFAHSTDIKPTATFSGSFIRIRPVQVSLEDIRLREQNLFPVTTITSTDINTLQDFEEANTIAKVLSPEDFDDVRREWAVFETKFK